MTKQTVKTIGLVVIMTGAAVLGATRLTSAMAAPLSLANAASLGPVAATPAMQNVQIERRRKTPGAAPVVWSGGPVSGGSYLGIDIDDVTSERASALKLKEERGVEITRVDQDAPAGKAGLKEHDVILQFNGARLEGEEQLRRLIRETPAGRKVTLDISRDGSPMTVTVTLAQRQNLMRFKLRGFSPKDGVDLPSGEMMEMPEMPEMPSMPDMPESPRAPRAPRIPGDPRIAQDFDVVVHTSSSLSGVMVDSLTRQLGEFFGAKDGQGVLVRSVEKGSAGEAAGLKAGDVIVSVEKERVLQPHDWRRILSMHSSGGKISVNIIRNKKEQTLSMVVPDRHKHESLAMPGDMPEIEELDTVELGRIGEQVRLMRPQIERVAQLAMNVGVQKALSSAEKQLRAIEPKLRAIEKQINSGHQSAEL